PQRNGDDRGGGHERRVVDQRVVRRKRVDAKYLRVAVAEEAVQQAVDALVRPVCFAEPRHLAQHVEVTQVIVQTELRDGGDERHRADAREMRGESPVAANHTPQQDDRVLRLDETTQADQDAREPALATQVCVQTTGDEHAEQYLYLAELIALRQ